MTELFPGQPFQRLRHEFPRLANAMSKTRTEAEAPFVHHLLFERAKPQRYLQDYAYAIQLAIEHGGYSPEVAELLVTTMNQDRSQTATHGGMYVGLQKLFGEAEVDPDQARRILTLIRSNTTPERWYGICKPIARFLTLMKNDAEKERFLKRLETLHETGRRVSPVLTGFDFAETPRRIRSIFRKLNQWSDRIHHSLSPNQAVDAEDGFGQMIYHWLENRVDDRQMDRINRELIEYSRDKGESSGFSGLLMGLTAEYGKKADLSRLATMRRVMQMARTQKDAWSVREILYGGHDPGISEKTWALFFDELARQRDHHANGQRIWDVFSPHADRIEPAIIREVSRLLLRLPDDGQQRGTVKKIKSILSAREDNFHVGRTLKFLNASLNSGLGASDAFGKATQWASEPDRKAWTIGNEAISAGLDPFRAMDAWKAAPAWTEKAKWFRMALSHRLILTPGLLDELKSQRAATRKDALDRWARRSRELQYAEPVTYTDRQLFHHQVPEVPLEAYLKSFRKDPEPTDKPLLFDPFSMEIPRRQMHVPKPVLQFLESERKRIQDLLESTRSESPGIDAENPAAARDGMLRKGLADSALREKILYGEPAQAMEGLLELHSDRCIDQLKSGYEFGWEKKYGRIRPVLADAGLRTQFKGIGELFSYLSKFQDVTGLRTQIQEKIRDAKESLSAALRADDHAAARTIGDRIADYRTQLAEFNALTPEQVAVANGQRRQLASGWGLLEDDRARIEHAYRRVKPADEGKPVKLWFDCSPSHRDRYAGYYSQDCTKGMYALFSGKYVYNTKIRVEENGHQRPVGNMYHLFSPKDRDIHHDAIQLPLQIDHEQMAREFPARLLSAMHQKARQYLESGDADRVKFGKTLLSTQNVSIGDELHDISNHKSIQAAWDSTYGSAEVRSIHLPHTARKFQTYGAQHRVVYTGPAEQTAGQKKT